MKKQLFSILAMAVLALGLTSCAKDDPATVVEIDHTRTATVQGKILVNTDETITPARWSAPSSVNFIATLPYSSLHSGASGTYVIPQENISYNSSTGEFTITAPVGYNGSAVTVKFEDFKGEVRKNVGGNQTNVKVIWKTKTASAVTVHPGETNNLTYWKLNGSTDYTVDTNAGDDI